MNYLQALEKIGSYKGLVGTTIKNKVDETSCKIKYVTAIKVNYDVQGDIRNILDPEYVKTIINEDLIVVFIANSNYTPRGQLLISDSLYLLHYQ